MQITQNKCNKLNLCSVASYDLRRGNGVVTILVEWEVMDKRRKWVKRIRKEKRRSKKKQKISEWTREEETGTLSVYRIQRGSA